MFVRTKEGKIFDCVVGEQMGKPIYYSKNSKTNGYIDWNEVYKKSENIIDILEVGDYVNGYKVVKIDDLTCYDNRIGSKYIEIDFNVENDYEHWCEDTILQNPDIKSIVTKEQFSSVSYEVSK